MQSQLQGGNKEYLLLFNLLDASITNDIKQIKDEFRKQSSNGSWDNTCNYLSSLLLDSLVQAKKEKDIFFQLLQQIQQIKILKERSLDEEAFKQMKKVRQKAAKYQLHWIEYYCCRSELNYYSDNNFPELNDDELIKLQMKGKDVLKSLNHIHDHYSLYELLKHRLIKAGKIVSEEGKKKLNDLMLSEMVLVAGKAKSFSSQKLHLLFQSYFFTDIGDYHSAAKSFSRLNDLLEQNEAVVDNPPLDYLSALSGIMDSLHMLKNNSEAPYYLGKIKSLDQSFFPEFFRYLVRKTFCVQQIITLLQSDDVQTAAQFVELIAPDVFHNYALIDDEKQCELYFFCSLVYFKSENWRRAHLFLREIMNQQKLPEHLLISKAIRLLNILTYYEKGELPHLEYEIRSYKRYFASKLLKIERIIFRIISSSAGNKRLLLMQNEKRKMLLHLEDIKKDKYEQQLLKYFDFADWVMNILQLKTNRLEKKIIAS